MNKNADRSDIYQTQEASAPGSCRAPVCCLPGHESVRLVGVGGARRCLADGALAGVSCDPP